MGLILLLLLVFLIAGVAPWHGYSRPYGWYPSGILGVVLLIVLVLILLGAIPHGVGTHPHYW